MQKRKLNKLINRRALLFCSVLLMAPSSAWDAGLGRQPGGDECAVFDAKENSRRNPSSAPWVISLSVGGGGSNQLGAAREGSATGL